jgi:hypothetical protein
MMYHGVKILVDKDQRKPRADQQYGKGLLDVPFAHYTKSHHSQPPGDASAESKRANEKKILNLKSLYSMFRLLIEMDPEHHYWFHRFIRDWNFYSNYLVVSLFTKSSSVLRRVDPTFEFSAGGMAKRGYRKSVKGTGAVEAKDKLGYASDEEAFNHAQQQEGPFPRRVIHMLVKALLRHAEQNGIKFAPEEAPPLRPAMKGSDTGAPVTTSVLNLYCDTINQLVAANRLVRESMQEKLFIIRGRDPSYEWPAAIRASWVSLQKWLFGQGKDAFLFTDPHFQLASKATSGTEGKGLSQYDPSKMAVTVEQMLPPYKRLLRRINEQVARTEKQEANVGQLVVSLITTIGATDSVAEFAVAAEADKVARENQSKAQAESQAHQEALPGKEREAESLESQARDESDAEEAQKKSQAATTSQS